MTYPTDDERAELEDMVAYPLRRWLLKPRHPDDARLGAKRIVEYLRMCRVRIVKADPLKPPRTPEK